jgi:hypothetical protein
MKCMGSRAGLSTLIVLLLAPSVPAPGQSISSITSSWNNLDFNGNVSAYTTNVTVAPGTATSPSPRPVPPPPTPVRLGFWA